MAEPGLIASYLNELRLELVHDRHGLARPAAQELDDIVDECADHLETAVEHLMQSGQPQRDAELAALARYGSPSLIARLEAAERRRGAAVPTTFTRAAGAAGVTIPLLAVAAAAAEAVWEDGVLAGSVGVLWGTAFIAFLLFVAGLAVRHRGALGRTGRAGMVLFFLAPFAALPFAWGAPIAWGVMVSVALGLMALPMWRSAVLPRSGVAALGLTGLATWTVTFVGSVAGLDMGIVPLAGATALAAATVIVGLAMAREVPVTASPSSPNGPAVVA